MSYEEAREATITRDEALSEIEKHHADRFNEACAEFFDEVGDWAEYRGDAVLNWLGY